MKHDVSLAQLRPLTECPDESLARLGRVEIPEHERDDLYRVADRVANMDARGVVSLEVEGAGQCLFSHDWTGADGHLIGFLGTDGVLCRDDARCPSTVPVVLVRGREGLRDAYAADADFLSGLDAALAEGWV